MPRRATLCFFASELTMIHQRILPGHRKNISGPKAVNGFTLPELLIAGILAAAVAAMTAQVMINQLLEGRRFELAQRNRENISRLNYLIQIEGSEAEEIEYGAAGNPDDCPGGGESFTFLVPLPEGTYADPVNRSRVQYYNADAEGIPSIWRCGPPVTRNGVLCQTVAQPGCPSVQNTAGVVMRNAQLDLDPNSSTDRGVTYRVLPTGGLPGGNLGDLGGFVTAHARSVFVCNPPVTGNPQIGDCS